MWSRVSKVKVPAQCSPGEPLLSGEQLRVPYAASDYFGVDASPLFVPIRPHSAASAPVSDTFMLSLSSHPSRP